jgi:hypothetical protein
MRRSCEKETFEVGGEIVELKIIPMKNILLFLSFNLLVGFTLKAQTTIANDANNLDRFAKLGTVTIPANGYYLITVKGAGGGSKFVSSEFILGTIVAGGKGGVFSSEYYFIQGTVLEYCLGAGGENSLIIDNGGGGGTEFAFRAPVAFWLLLVAAAVPVGIFIVFSLTPMDMIHQVMAPAVALLSTKIQAMAVAAAVLIVEVNTYVG